MTLPAPYFEADGVTVYCADNREVLPHLGAVGCVLTDPPYSAKVHGASRRAGDLARDNDTACSKMRTTDLGFEPITREVMAFCADRFADICQRWCLVFSDVEIAHEWRSELQVAGMEYVRTGAWIKIGCTPQFTGDRPAAGHESITITHRPGKKRWNGGGSHAVWSVPIVLNRGGNAERVHTTQKPLALMRELVRLFTDPGETVLDCFGGSGTTAVACRDLGRRCIVVEREEKYCALIVERLRQQILLAPAAPQPEQSALDLEATR